MQDPSQTTPPTRSASPGEARGLSRSPSRFLATLGITRRHCCIALTLLLPNLSGCSDFGVGGTGELVVPPQRFRQIDAMTLPAATTQRGSADAPVTPPAELRLSVAEVRRLALEHNLDVRAQLIEPSIAQQSLDAERAKFEALFRLDAGFSRVETSDSALGAGGTRTQYDLTPALVVPLVSGGSIALEAPVSRLDRASAGSSDRSYEPGLGVRVRQPLLRGAWTDANAQSIRLAFYRRQQSEAQTRLTVIRLLAEADRAYWRLYAAREVLDVRQRELALARAQLDRARRQAAAGVAAEVDVTRAESGVADRVESVINAETSLRERQRELKRLLNLPDVPIESPTRIVPTAEPVPFEFAFDVEQLARDAVASRMGMLELELQLAAQAATILAARNATLPLVSLEYQYNVSGVDDSLSGSFSQLRRFDDQDHRLGLVVEVPLGNQAARSRLRESLLTRLQTLATREAREQAIRLEVYNAADRLRSNWQRIQAARQRVVLAARVVELETRQFDLGLRTSTDVLDAQTRLANARTDEIAALVDYQVAQVDLAFASGTLLGRDQVTWSPYDGPSDTADAPR